jgi:hypothetical protein
LAARTSGAASGRRLFVPSALAQGFAQWAAASESFELAAPQVLPILNRRVRAEGVGAEELGRLHSAIGEDVNRDGRRWISQAVVNGEKRDPRDDHQLPE